jgi:hypothetical protein
MSMEKMNKGGHIENSSEKQEFEKAAENIKQLTNKIKGKLEKKNPAVKEDPEITESVESISRLTNIVLGATAGMGVAYEGILGAIHLLEYNPHFSTDYSDMKLFAIYFGVVMVIEKLASLGMIKAVKSQK